MTHLLRLIALVGLVATSLSACVVVPVPARRAYVEPPAAVIVAPYPRYEYGHRGYRRW